MSDWSPYSLEKYRTHTGGRSWGVVLLFLAIVAVWLFLALSQTTSYSVNLNGNGGNTINLQQPPAVPPTVTVQVSPGQVAVVDTSAPASNGNGGPSRVANNDAYPIIGWLLTYGPVALAPWIIRRIWTRPVKTEVNYGIYKGAMPPESILATPAEILHPRRAVHDPLFGRTRRDFVGEYGK